MSEMPPRLEISFIREVLDGPLKLKIKMGIQTDYMEKLGFLRKDHLDNFNHDDEFNQSGGLLWTEEDEKSKTSFSKKFNAFFDEHYSQIIKTPEAKSIVLNSQYMENKIVNIFIILFEKYFDEFKSEINFSFHDTFKKGEVATSDTSSNASEEAA